MNGYMQQIMNALVPILCLLITAGGLYLVALFRKRTAQIEKELNNETASKYIQMACDAVDQVVTSIAQTFVDALKAEDAFTEEKQAAAFNTAKETVLNILGETAVLALREIYGDFDAWLDTKIEQKCRGLKAGETEAALEAVASAAATVVTSSVQILEVGLGKPVEPEPEATDDTAERENALLQTFTGDSYK